jgi:DNA-binding GntR family transcriptional regulator
LHVELLNELRRLIVEGEYPPGQRIQERILCERFGVSRTPLREALKVLASEGLIELTPNRGATVSQITAADIDEVFPVMGAIEALSGELAAQRIDEDGLAGIRALHYQMVLHYRLGELPDYFRCNQRIHEKILEAAGNATLSGVYRGLAGRVRRARYFANMSPLRWKKAIEEHEEILAALEARDAKRLAGILRDHLRNKCETVKELLLAEQRSMEREKKLRAG